MPAREVGDAQLARVLQDRDEQALFRVDGDAEMLAVRVGHGSGIQVERRVHAREHLEAFDGGFREEGEERQLRPFALKELGLVRIAQCGECGDIDLDDRRQLRGGLKRLGHASRDGLPQLGSAFQ